AAVYDRFAPRFVAALEALRVGDPLDRRTELGPLATAAILDTLASQVERSVGAGGRLLTRGRRLPRPGGYYRPTLPAHPPARAPRPRRRAVRAGGGALPGPRRRRGARARQRQRLRARRQRLDARPRRGRARGARARGGVGVRQRDGGVRSALPVRRRQALRL